MIRLVPVIAIVVIGLSIWYFGFHKPKRRKQQSTNTGRVAVAPAIVPVEDRWPSRQPEERPALAEGDDELRNDLWLDLCKLLRGESEDNVRKMIAIDGVFRHRAGMMFTVYHGADVCVIVRAQTRAHANVTRIVVDMKKPSILAVDEPRVSPEGLIRDISADQARNTSTDGMKDYATAEIGFTVNELGRSPRQGSF